MVSKMKDPRGHAKVFGLANINQVNFLDRYYPSVLSLWPGRYTGTGSDQIGLEYGVSCSGVPGAGATLWEPDPWPAPPTSGTHLLFSLILYQYFPEPDSLNPDPAFQVNPDTDPDPGFWWPKTDRKNYSRNLLILFSVLGIRIRRIRMFLCSRIRIH